MSPPVCPSYPGRDTLWTSPPELGGTALALAQHGLQVDAVDISGQGLHLAQQRTIEAGLTPAQIRFIMADLERPWLPQRGYEVILVSFFLYRPLFPLIKERLRSRRLAGL